MAEIRKVSFQDSNGNIYYLETSTDQVFDEDGNNLGDLLTLMKDDLGEHKAEIATQDKLGHIKTTDIVTSVANKKGNVTLSLRDIDLTNAPSKLNIGYKTTVDSSWGVAVGRMISTEGDYPVALGDRSTITNDSLDSIVIGTTSNVSAMRGIAIGYSSTASGKHSVAISTNSKALNDNDIALGGDTHSVNILGELNVRGTKNFEMPHPKPEKMATHRIRHGTVETPSAGDNLYRYQITSTKDNDTQIIDLPDYFIHLNKNVQVFVTPQEHFGNGYGNLNRGTEQLEIHCESEGKYNILVIGTRNDNHQSVQNWDVKGVEREIGESWNGETYVFEVEEITDVEEILRIAEFEEVI